MNKFLIVESETFYHEGLTCTTMAIIEQNVWDYITSYNSIRMQIKLNSQSPLIFKQLAV
ncbi:IS3 family transposase [Paenibacillus sp. AK121]|nr:IS3 family transposase [Paenibacillus sp. AK121]